MGNFRGAGSTHIHSPTAAVSLQVPDKSFHIARRTGRIYWHWCSCQAQEMPSLKTERRIRPGSQEGLAAPRAVRPLGAEDLGRGGAGPSGVTGCASSAGRVRPSPGRSARPRLAAAAASRSLLRSEPHPARPVPSCPDPAR